MFATLLDALHAAPDKRTFVTHWRSDHAQPSLTFGAFRTHAQRVAAWLAQEQIGPGDVVAWVLPHGLDLLTAFAGTLWRGAVPAILAYPTFKVDPAKYRASLVGVAQHLDAASVVLAPQLPASLRAALADHAPSVLCEYPTDLPPLTAVPPAAAPSPHDIAFIQHSGGTTGQPKAVAVTHAQACNHLRNLAHGLGLTADYTHEDVMVSWLPYYHDMGLVTALLLPLVSHLPVVTLDPATWVMDPLRHLHLLDAYRGTLAFLPNFAFQFLADRLRRQPPARLDLCHVRALVNASEPVRAANMDALATAARPYGLAPSALHTLYGMAENVMGATLSNVAAAIPPVRLWVQRSTLHRHAAVQLVPPASPSAVQLVSCGRCLPNTRLRVVDDQGRDLPDGTVGELLIHSDSLFAGYHRRPDLTAQTLRDGWYWSGDLGFRHANEIYVTGRLKDLIIIGGRNIFPDDVEAVVNTLPAIHPGRVAALGIPNPATGTEELAVVAELATEPPPDAAPTDLAAVERDIRRAVAAALDLSVKHIFLHRTRWIIKSTAGKPARAETRARLLAEHPELGAGSLP